ncbi:MAG: hypothetical protein ABEI06_06275, partial [Halobacteriaceae archaeon]
ISALEVMAMQPRQRSTDTLSPGTKKRLRAHAWLIAQLPDPGETFQVQDVDRIQNTKGLLALLHDVGVIRRVGHDNDGVSKWEVREGVKEYVADYRSNRSELPCGHTGFVNLGDGEYKCSYDGCDRRYSRQMIEEVFGE